MAEVPTARFLESKSDEISSKNGNNSIETKNGNPDTVEDPRAVQEDQSANDLSAQVSNMKVQLEMLTALLNSSKHGKEHGDSQIQTPENSEPGEVVTSALASMHSSMEGKSDTGDAIAPVGVSPVKANDLHLEISGATKEIGPIRLAGFNIRSGEDGLNVPISPLPVPSHSSLQPVKQKAAGLNRVDWTNFKTKYFDEPEYAIDVLMGPAKFFWQRQREERNMKRRGDYSQQSDSQIVESRHTEMAQLIKNQQEMPERIRINSYALIAILKEISSEDWETKPMVMLRPYKFLVTYEKDIRQWLADLEAKATPPSVSGGRTENEEPSEITKEEEGRSKDKGETEPTDIQKTLDEASTISQPNHDTDEDLQSLRCLVEFMDKDVMPVYHKYETNASNKIFFRDLWYLFRPGVEVISWQDLDGLSTSGRDSNLAVLETSTSKQGSDRTQPVLWRVLHACQGRPVLGVPHSSSTDKTGGRMRAPAKHVNPLKILCYRIGYDGTIFGPIDHTFDIPAFEGEKEISSLDPCPSMFVAEYESIKAKSIFEGRKFIIYKQPTHQFFVGASLRNHPGGIPCKLVKKVSMVEGNVIVDFKEAARDNPAWVLKPKIPDASGGSGLESTEDYPLWIWSDKDRNKPGKGQDEWIYDDNNHDDAAMEEFISSDSFLTAFKNRVSDEEVNGKAFTESELVLLPDRVCAFDLHRRTFCILPLDGLMPVRAKTEGWADLKLPRGHKRMVQAQVKTHFREKRLLEQNFDGGTEYDLVHGKGRGLIILLHGAPGVGKTSTAECVAESLEKPLYPITCGDLGVTAKAVEDTLSETFAKAEVWDCVLLLDEADVFLAQRTRTDLERNAIVSGQSYKIYRIAPMLTLIQFFFVCSNTTKAF
jgi:hypothetical protein